jgi:hypothetical protein
LDGELIAFGDDGNPAFPASCAKTTAQAALDDADEGLGLVAVANRYE